MTIKDIANTLGISPSTVSRVLNNKRGVARPELCEKIFKLANDMGYKPNISAQNLRRNSDPIVKGDFICIFARSSDNLNDQFFFSLFSAIKTELTKNDYSIKYTLSFLDSDLQGLSSIIENDPMISGVFVLGRSTSDQINRLKSLHKNLVYVGLNPINTIIDQVLCNGYEMACNSIDYLFSLGHTHIAYLGEINNEIRFDGYNDKIQELNLTEGLVFDFPLSIEGGYKGTKHIVESKKSISAIFCCNDYVAIGALRALSECHINVPNDISIIGIDDIEMSSFSAPALTTTKVPRHEMGRFAVSLIIDRIKRVHSSPLKVEFPFNLIERETCASIKKGRIIKKLSEITSKNEHE